MGRGLPIMANRTKVLISKIFDLGIGRDLVAYSGESARPFRSKAAATERRPARARQSTWLALPLRCRPRHHLTTAGFSREARAIAFDRGAPPIALIDGDALVGLLIEHGIGVEKRKIELWSLDASAFVGEVDNGA